MAAGHPVVSVQKAAYTQDRPSAVLFGRRGLPVFAGGQDGKRR
ncbi:hypothetical protein SDC9_134460 [bioreactor metagenome]|uniref:Uncharacterized protein n=1 Tax=bioreactor metagenome TaxID=1076179 RepID=A0A645DD94_9ZZZZ